LSSRGIRSRKGEGIVVTLALKLRGRCALREGERGEAFVEGLVLGLGLFKRLLILEAFKVSEVRRIILEALRSTRTRVEVSSIGAGGGEPRGSSERCRCYAIGRLCLYFGRDCVGSLYGAEGRRRGRRASRSITFR